MAAVKTMSRLAARTAQVKALQKMNAELLAALEEIELRADNEMGDEDDWRDVLPPWIPEHLEPFYDIRETARAAIDATKKYSAHG